MLANWKKRVFPLNRRQAVFAMLLCLVLAVNAVPALRASALYLITDGEATTAVEQAEPVTADKLIVVGAADGSDTRSRSPMGRTRCSTPPPAPMKRPTRF